MTLYFLQTTALRKHIKILEDRLRGERHTHAAKFSEIEKSLIQENAKLKVQNTRINLGFFPTISFVLDSLF